MQVENNKKQYHSQNWYIHHQQATEIFKIQTEDYVFDFRQSSYQIQSNDVGILKYVNNGQVIRIEKQTNSNYQNYKNFEQLKYLRWKGYLDKKTKNIGFWVIFWKADKQNFGGYCNKDGLLIGIWREISENYWEQSQVINFGEYDRGSKQGKWNIQYRFYQDIQYITINGGRYDEKGFKIGKWNDLNKNFFLFGQILYKGEYHQNKKQGIWDILFKSNSSNQYQIIGGGTYDENGQKKGKWIDVFDNFHEYCQIIEVGQYQEGKKIGKWNLLERFRQDQNFKIIGGGIYDLKGLKKGIWIDLKENFWQFDNKVLYIGEYKQGKKCGKWNIHFQEEDYQSYYKIGGGNYNEDGQKQGRWIDLHENFFKDCLVVQTGEYQNGTTVGFWEIQFCRSIHFHIIGCGIYLKNSVKNGKWVDLHENFYSNCLVVQIREYIQGIKYGRWDSFHTFSPTVAYKKIGGGDYDQNGMKNGQWLDLHERFWRHCQIIYTGQFFSGIKKGKWTSSLRSDLYGTLKLVGGGNYNEQGQKTGNWIELSEQFQECEQDTIKCTYNQGIRQGKIKRQNL